MNVLFVVAHPDDEVLGAGATIAKLTEEGHVVDVFVLNTYDATQYKSAEQHQRLLLDSDRILDVRSTIFGGWPDSEMHNAEHRKMVQAIESVIVNCRSQIVFTQHPADINTDHFWCFQSVIEAFRIGQRQRSDVHPLESLYLMEVLSSTDWHLDPSVRAFEPNVFAEVSQAQLEKKIKALSLYSGVLRSAPHPRRPETIMAQATLRGAQAGYPYAEAFQCVFKRGL